MIPNIFLIHANTWYFLFNCSRCNQYIFWCYANNNTYRLFWRTWAGTCPASTFVQPPTWRATGSVGPCSSPSTTNPTVSHPQFRWLFHWQFRLICFLLCCYIILTLNTWSNINCLPFQYRYIAVFYLKIWFNLFVYIWIFYLLYVHQPFWKY